MVRIRAAQPTDDDAIDAIDAVVWNKANTPAPLPLDGGVLERNGLENTLVAELDDEVVGYLTLRARHDIPSNAHVGMINGIAVAPTARGSGVGAALLEAAIIDARARGWKKLALNVMATNERARALYTAAGFQVEGRFSREWWIDGEWVDDLVMARWLED